MADSPDNDLPDNGDDDFSTSDFFDRQKEQVEEAEKELRAQKALEERSQKLEELCDRVTQLVHNEKKRNSFDAWEDIFDRLKRDRLWNESQFEDRLHKELLLEFGYDPLTGDQERPARKMDRPPIRGKVIRYIFKKMNWDRDRSDNLLARQRLWIQQRAGAVRGAYPKSKRRKRPDSHKGSKKSSHGCFWVILIIFLIFIFA